MNKIKIQFFSVLLCGCMFLLPSCEKKDVPVSVGTTFLIGSESGAVTRGEIPCDGVWQITDVPEWLEISPMSGGGDAAVTISTLSANGDISEREGSFNLHTSSGDILCYVFQSGRPGLSAPKKCWPYSSGGRYVVEVRTNIEYSVMVEAEWIKLESVDYFDSDVLLSDGKTVSEVMRSEAVFSVEPNTSESRSCEVVLSAGGQTYTMLVTQNAEGEIEWERDFYRQTSILRMTGTGCQWCPDMAVAIEEAQGMCPDRIVDVSSYGEHFSIHPGLNSPICSDLEKYFMTTGYPSAYINGIAMIPNMGFDLIAVAFRDMALDAVRNYPSRTCIAANTSVTGREVTVSMDLAVKTAGEYSVAVYLCENGIVHPQSVHDGTDENYVHDGVIRASFTEIFGDPFSVTEDNTVTSVEIKGSVPEEVNMDNAYVVVFVYYPGGPGATEVQNVNYMDYGNVLDNIVEVPLGGSIGYRYEE